MFVLDGVYVCTAVYRSNIIMPLLRSIILTMEEHILPVTQLTGMACYSRKVSLHLRHRNASATRAVPASVGLIGTVRSRPLQLLWRLAPDGISGSDASFRPTLCCLISLHSQE